MSKIFADRKLALTILCLTLLYTTWGMVYLSIRFALESFPPVLLSGMRYVCAGSALLFWAVIIKKDWKMPTFREFRVLTLGSFWMIVVAGALLNISEVYLSSGITALILGSTPLWMVIAGWLFSHEERPSLIAVIGLIGGFIGIAVLGIATGLEGKGSVFGILCALGSVLGWVAGSLFAKTHKVAMDMLKSLGFQMLMGGIFMVVFAWFIGEYDTFYFSNVTLKSWLSLIHLVVFGSLVGYTSYIWLLYNTPTPVSVSYAYVEPVLAVFMGATFAGEAVTKSTVTACVFIIVSVIFVMWHKTAIK